MVSLIAAIALAPSLPLGEYRLNMGSEWRKLRLVSPSLFTFRAQGCFHGEDVEGHYVVTGGRILFDPAVPLALSGERTGELEVVRWGGASLLVRRHEMAGLAAMARGADDPAKVAGWFLHMPKAVEGLSGVPEVPKPFDRYLRASPLFRVRFVERKSATIEGGTRDGLLPGTALEAGNGKVVALVRRASADRAEVGWIALGEEASLRAGDRLTVAKGDTFLLGQALGPTLMKPAD